MCARKGLGLQSEILSDVAPLNGLTAAMLAAGGEVKFMRDPTRGGLSGLLADLAEMLRMGIEIEEDAIPLSPACRHVSELLGLDPLSVANEGKVVAVVAAADAEKLLAACRAHPLGRQAAIIGHVGDKADWPLVELITRAGGRRIVQRPYGEELPRIC
jgi:hydrogenase expression/formation protein HypE